MQSWMMQLWLNNHDKRDWPDQPIYQPEDACHVTGAEEHPSKEVIEKMCSESFFSQHKYLYVESIQQRFTSTVDEEDYESTEPANTSQSLQQESSIHCQSSRESLSTARLFSDHSSKFGQGEQEVESIGNGDYYYSSPAVEDTLGEERGCSMCQPEDAFSEMVDQDHYELYEFPEDSCHPQKTQEMYGPKHELRLENSTGYRELDKTNVDYMPLSKEQSNGEEPCLPQYSGDDSSTECYMCVDLLVEDPHQRQEDDRSSSGPMNSAEILQNVEYKLKCDSSEDLAIQKLLKDAECLYQDIVQGRKKDIRR